MGNTALRLYILSAVVVAIYWVARWEKYALQPPPVQLPKWTFDELPLQLGDWQGEPAKLDPEIYKAVGAAPGRIVNRIYRDEMGHQISMHTAMFMNPIDGVYHSPLNCYRANGWELVNKSREELRLFDNLTLPVILTTWQQEGNRKLVVFWYQLGNHVLFDRMDLGLRVRWSLAGKPRWPALVKVMLQIDAGELGDAKATILSFAEQVAKWENQPQRRKQLLLTEEDAESQKPKTQP